MPSKHTPGPWEITDHGQTVDGDYWYSINKGEIDIAYERWSNNDEPTRRANARLIAASPDLLEAAKRIYEQLYGDPMTWADQIKWQDAAEALKAAIAKAEGE